MMFPMKTSYSVSEVFQGVEVNWAMISRRLSSYLKCNRRLKQGYGNHKPGAKGVISNIQFLDIEASMNMVVPLETSSL